MNKKLKVLSSVICGLVLSSGLALTSVQAAPVQNNINAISTNTKLDSYGILAAFKPSSQANFLNTKISETGTITWDSIPNAAGYYYKVVMQSPSYGLGFMNKGMGSGHFRNNTANIMDCFNQKGTYYVITAAQDSEGNYLQYELNVAYYDGTNVYQATPFN